MKIIDRPHYISKIEKNFDKNTILILTGQRRVGKSYLLRSIRDRLSGSSDCNVIFIDKEKKDFDAIITYDDLNSYIDS